jgi:hypothetical protein
MVRGGPEQLEVSMDRASPHPLITASRLDGTSVFNTTGDRVGYVKDLSIDKRVGTSLWLSAVATLSIASGCWAFTHPMAQCRIGNWRRSDWLCGNDDGLLLAPAPLRNTHGMRQPVHQLSSFSLHESVWNSC